MKVEGRYESNDEIIRDFVNLRCQISDSCAKMDLSTIQRNTSYLFGAMRYYKTMLETMLAECTCPCNLGMDTMNLDDPSLNVQVEEKKDMGVEFLDTLFSLGNDRPEDQK